IFIFNITITRLPADTPLPYVPSEAGFATPKYRITNFSRNEITHVQISKVSPGRGLYDRGS
ncbi:MAG: hypothetical protein K2K29_06955, partial [Muribaculaceae bacterium]|nr:hypothetical protein [Muribaculaceae bacterium]